MTKEEAKLVLDNARPQTKEIDRQFYDDEDLNNALNMAIKALEQQPCDDCVSRADARHLIAESFRKNLLGITFNKMFETLYKGIDELPPVTPTMSSSDDCIARQPLIDNWNCCADMLMGEGDSAIVMDWIFDAPPVTPTRRWIPVSESLPKENGLYQCTVILNDLPRTMELFYKNGKWLDNRRINMFDTYDIYGYGNTKEKHKLSYQELISEFEWNQVIIAWQPLPRPYEEKRGNSDGRN